MHLSFGQIELNELNIHISVSNLSCNLLGDASFHQYPIEHEHFECGIECALVTKIKLENNSHSNSIIGWNKGIHIFLNTCEWMKAAFESAIVNVVLFYSSFRHMHKKTQRMWSRYFFFCEWNGIFNEWQMRANRNELKKKCIVHVWVLQKCRLYNRFSG